ncbi:MAG: RdgB/HAM1 family non-canonical purine NTP pyrophosphatase [Vicinamibacterales bacterium]
MQELDGELLSLAESCLTPPEETGSTFDENSLIKARAAAGAGDLAIADDSGLVVDALDGRPGVRSSRFAGDDATDADNNALLLEEMAAVSEDRRTARFVSVVAIVSADGWEHVARGTIEGRIGHSPRGDGGFGYDPLFMIEDDGALEFAGRTMAELSLEEKNRISHRARAYRSLLRIVRDSGGSFAVAGRRPGVAERS